MKNQFNPQVTVVHACTDIIIGKYLSYVVMHDGEPCKVNVDHVPVIDVDIQHSFELSEASLIVSLYSGEFLELRPASPVELSRALESYREYRSKPKVKDASELAYGTVVASVKADYSRYVNSVTRRKLLGLDPKTATAPNTYNIRVTPEGVNVRLDEFNYVLDQTQVPQLLSEVENLPYVKARVIDNGNGYGAIYLKGAVQ